jgi:hypothetical protein
MRYVTRITTLLTAGLFVSTLAFAEPPAERDEQQTPPRSLDDLLGVDDDERAEEAARHEHDDELQRRLADEARQGSADALADAVQKMGVSADLLERRLDSGLGTQRVQEEVLAKLAHLINQARQQSSSSSSSQSSRRSEPSPQDPGRQQQQQLADDCAGEGQEGEPPAMQQAEVSISLEETRAEWGNLPARVREMLLQGRQERFSSLYEHLTREYYRRLAED